MVALNLVKESNARLQELGPGLVALFVGGTSGIGEYTAKAFVQNTKSPRVYLVGRNEPTAQRIIEECKALNKESEVKFIKADVSELKEVDRVCKEIQSKEKHVNLLFQSQGNLNLRGRDESPEGLDRKLTLNYYSRMRFTSNLLPLLQTATTTSPSSFSRAVSLLAAGTERKINFDDLELKNTFSGPRCADHSVVMNDFMAEEFAKRQPTTTFMHGFPFVVATGIARELPWWARIGSKALTTVLSPWMISQEETGQRQLFHATSGIYPPAQPASGSKTSAGVSLKDGLSVIVGADEKTGSGAYLTHWNGDAIKQKEFLKEYRAQGQGKTIWDHTMGIFDRVEKLNAQSS